MTWLRWRCDETVNAAFIQKDGRRFERERFWYELRTSEAHPTCGGSR